MSWNPLPRALTLPRFPAGDHHPVRHLPVELLHQLHAHGLLALHPERVHGVGQVDVVAGTQLPHQRHAAVEVAVDGQGHGAVGNRLNELRRGHLVFGQEHDGADIRHCAIGRQGRGSVAGGGARHRGDIHPFRDHLAYHGHQHGHAQVLEGPGVAVAAQLDPELGHPDFLAQPLRPEEVAAAFEGRDHVGISHLRTDHLPLAPDRAAVGPLGPHQPLVEEILPILGGLLAQEVQIMAHLQEIAAPRTFVDDFLEAVASRAAGNALEPRPVGILWSCLDFLRLHDSSSNPDGALTQASGNFIDRRRGCGRGRI